MINFLQTQYYSSTNDQGSLALANAWNGGLPTFVDSYVLNGPNGQLAQTGQFLSSGDHVAQYFFPNTPPHAFDGPIPPYEQDGLNNNQAIFKLQYTKSLGTNAVAKLYGYTYYSDWLQTGPNTTYADFIGCCSPDYELSNHTRGLNLDINDQLNSQNLLSFNASYTTASSLRANNSFYASQLTTKAAVLVDSSNPTNGMCYSATGVQGSYYAGTCQTANFKAIQGGTVVQPAAGTTCGTGTCQYLLVANGQSVTYNQVKPEFYGVSLGDEFRPNSKLTINGSIRLDDYGYQLPNTQGTAARTWWYNAYNMNHCATSAGIISTKASPTDPCPAGTSPTQLASTAATSVFYPTWQPRLGATYTLSPNTVLRASYGRFGQAPNSAFEQYNYQQANSPNSLAGFYPLGFTTPNHRIPPAASNNYDFSIEQQFGGEIAMKISPFLRTTQNQIQQFYLDQKTNFVSGLNVGKQTSEGVEFELDKGNFAEQGLTGRLTFTYTNSYITYEGLPNGTTVLDPINQAIAGYNAYTKACAPGGSAANAKQFGTAVCGSTTSGVVAAPCYDTAGNPLTTCASGDVANPYWNAPVQSLFNPTGNYRTLDTFAGGVGSTVGNVYGAPYVGTLVLNERMKGFALTPILQFTAGQRYGAPETTYGVDPLTCTGVLPGSVASDPRYQYGAAGGSPFDNNTCGQQGGATPLTIPNPYTGKFDSIGAFVTPSSLILSIQATYDFNPKVSVIANFSNVYAACFGGTKVPWSTNGSCGYGVLVAGTTGGLGNLYNPGDAIQPGLVSPYNAGFGVSNPFEANLAVRFKL
jgi:hypothetical protein